MGFNRRVGTRARVSAVALGITVLAAGCAAPQERPTPSPTPIANVIPVGRLVAPPTVMSLANTFADQFDAGQYAAQWTELAPQAEGIWPSEAARTSMLSAKFGGLVARLTLGVPAF